MRQVIRRFLKHLVAEKNASPSTIDTYRYDLNKFADYMAHRLGSRFLPGDVSQITFGLSSNNNDNTFTVTARLRLQKDGKVTLSYQECSITAVFKIDASRAG